jgi:hypothetical protein
MRKRHRVTVAFTTPLAIFLLIISWVLLKIGAEQKPVQKKTPKIEELGKKGKP